MGGEAVEVFFLASPLGVEALEGVVLGGSWVVISGVISRVTTILTHIQGLITLLITTHEPPSRVRSSGCRL